MSEIGAVTRLQLMMDDHVKSFGAVGVLVGIDVPGTERVRLVSGKRVLGGDGLDPKVLYPIGSQTKTFVAIAILQLCKDGAISIDEPVSSRIKLPIDPRITFKHLIMNTSGLPEFLRLAKGSMGDSVSPWNLVESALLHGPHFEPGSRFDYSNTGWALAAIALDELVPGGYAGFIKDRIFKPLGMVNSYVAKGYPVDRLATGYLRRHGDDRPQPASSCFSMSWAYGAGDIVSTCDDMLDAYRALSKSKNAIGVTLGDLTSEIARPGAKVIHPASLGAEYAFGLERRSWGGAPVWGHPGRTPAYGAATWIAPDTGVIATTAYGYIADSMEPMALADQRYNAPLVFTQALATGHAIADQRSAAIAHFSPISQQA